MTDLNLAEWIPCNIAWDGVTPMVEWVYYAEPRYPEPFFSETLERSMQRPFNVLFRQRTSMETLERWAERSPGIPPAGFIFHVSRCGSTLITNLLGTLPSVLKISEAAPIDALLRARMRNPQISEAALASWLRALVSALGQRREEQQSRLFIKFDAWNTVNLSVIKAAFPEVPWIFVYRDPVEVMVSALRHRGAHMVPMALPPALFGMEIMESVQIPTEQFGARVLKAIYEAGLQGHSLGKSLLINYTELPNAVTQQIAPFFGCEPGAQENEAMREESLNDAKNRAIFVPDSEQKQKDASVQVREAAQQWVYPIYEQLEAKRLKLQDLT